MSFDVDQIVMGIGLACAVIYGVVELFLREKIDVANSVASSAYIFLMVWATGIGMELIYVAWQGDTENLPPSWRHYLAMAGIVVICFSLHHIRQTVNKLRLPSHEPPKEPK